MSLLPWFAHPYRLVQNVTLHRFATGQMGHADVLHWSSLLVSYWQRFEQWIPRLREVIHGADGRSPPNFRANEWWLWLMERWGGPEKSVTRLVEDHRITFFGEYRCHRPNPPP